MRLIKIFTVFLILSKNEIVILFFYWNIRKNMKEKGKEEDEEELYWSHSREIYLSKIAEKMYSSER